MPLYQRASGLLPLNAPKVVSKRRTTVKIILFLCFKSKVYKRLRATTRTKKTIVLSPSRDDYRGLSFYIIDYIRVLAVAKTRQFLQIFTIWIGQKNGRRSAQNIGGGSN
jgi:hypothetical protein